jgi:hypothetical protein
VKLRPISLGGRNCRRPAASATPATRRISPDLTRAAEIRRFPLLPRGGLALGTTFALIGVPAEQTGK